MREENRIQFPLYNQFIIAPFALRQRREYPRSWGSCRVII